jgi:SAM-dependent methyltransferase
LDARSRQTAERSFIDEPILADTRSIPMGSSQENTMSNHVTCDPSAAEHANAMGRGLPDFGPLKSRQQATWASGDFAVIGTTLQIVGEQLCEALDLRAGQRVLDVAAGNGNAAIAAARRWCRVTASDYVPALLQHAMERARAERLPLHCEMADAEALPFDDGSFDVVTSTFGAMFTPDHRKPALEMLRVCRSLGKIGLANWTPSGFIGELFKAIGAYIAPPVGMKSPALWGTESHIAELFGAETSAIETDVRVFMFRYRSADHWIDVFKTYYGPVLTSFEALDPAAQDALTADLRALITRFNLTRDGSMVVPGEYLQAVIVKR